MFQMTFASSIGIGGRLLLKHDSEVPLLSMSKFDVRYITNTLSHRKELRKIALDYNVLKVNFVLYDRIRL